MSYSAVTKNELARINSEKECCKKAELAALVKMAGNLNISGGRTSLDIKVHNAAVARKIFSLVKELFNITTQVMARRKVRLRKNNVYLVRVLPGEDVKKMLADMDMLDDSGMPRAVMPPGLLYRECCRRAFLRGVFLGGGSINTPERAYHLEITVNSRPLAGDIQELMADFDLSARISSRKNWYVIYLKESEQISTCLNIMGAHTAMLDFESKRVYKDMKNRVNRLVNCETANLGKTVDAALRQVEDIKFIDSEMGLDNLPLSLRTTAKARLEHPHASLRELGDLLVPPVGKSGINHRLRKLTGIAEHLRSEKEK